MPTTDYLWGAEALAGIKEKELDKHLSKFKDRYFGFARSALAQMRIAHDVPDFLQPDDLYVVLRDLITLDGELIRAFRDGGIADRLTRRWFSWFTWFLVHTFWDEEVNGDD